VHLPLRWYFELCSRTLVPRAADFGGRPAGLTDPSAGVHEAAFPGGCSGDARTTRSARIKALPTGEPTQRIP
jgi:hypothetical protein